MFYQSVNSDTLNTVKDTVANIQDSSGEVFNEIGFNLDNISSNDGILITIVGYIIVFCALMLLYLFISNLTKILIYQQRKRLKASGKDVEEGQELAITGEINAAIAAALFMHFAETHDFENTVLTIKKVQRPYSPWSSKIYGLRQFPRK
ncbi:MAG: OadG family protein [Melioribacteraceae bacterium]|nr:OadG family protein [Melioribacteraceae bacterium]MCF8354057.1 OadG family protein [Melioribacteraceae bacterium]MCF8393730.1 OadG family protein [Melioribacteraceae bacterium]MCF8417754.1 OadG family protein [Melioribacteraceae bacterium]